MTFMRTSIAALLAATATLLASIAHADDAPLPKDATPFGQRSRVIVSAENVFGGLAESISTSADTEDNSTSLNSNGLFPGFTGPRFGVHFVVGSSITVGLGLSAWSFKNTTVLSQSTSLTTIRVAPRVGWAPAIDGHFAVWLRAGPTLVYLHSTESDLTNPNPTYTFFDVSLEAYGVWTPYSHFGVMVGPSIDIPVSGKNGDETDLRFQSIGFLGGLFVDF